MEKKKRERMLQWRKKVFLWKGERDFLGRNVYFLKLKNYVTINLAVGMREVGIGLGKMKYVCIMVKLENSSSRVNLK